MSEIDLNRIDRHFEKRILSRIDALDDLSTDQKNYLKMRWLDQVLWANSQAINSRRVHYILRLTAVIGGIALMTLANVVFDYTDNDAILRVAKLLFNVVGFTVGTAIASASLFRYGERWQHYRHTTELLKSEGWQFMESSGDYHRNELNRSDFYHKFVARVEALIRQDLGEYLTKVAVEKGSETQLFDIKWRN